MWRSLRTRLTQGSPLVRDLRGAAPAGFRGRPVISAAPCADQCRACAEVCPTGAIALEPLRLDLGKCVFCNECALVCPEEKIRFTAETRMGARRREDLVVHEGQSGPPPLPVDQALRAHFGRSLRLRQVCAGSCNGCELELNAITNVNFDVQRYGIEWVASPRHADALVLTGPVTRHMAEAVRLAWDAMPEPRFLVATGACTISGGLYADGSAVERSVLAEITPALYVPGCPPHPLTFVIAILDLLGIGVS
jgi:Ni,Fe-hydrogenase III small subunit/NAD-dependent dihydropyrimidine dehydrogenase PreA subunit